MEQIETEKKVVYLVLELDTRIGLNQKLNVLDGIYVRVSKTNLDVRL